MLRGKLEGALTPAFDVAPELFVASVVELELVSSQPAELSEHVGEDGQAEAEVLLGCEPTSRSSKAGGAQGTVDPGTSRPTAAPSRSKKSRPH